ncbi:response regulator [Derxia lacustris]|uniref:response regulator n=1 Tax=Derxia lacustris TaxID=764842 RepID=UPI000A16E3B7|nr:response regulator [Derxia lacustris]
MSATLAVNTKRTRHALLVDDDKFMLAVLGDMLRDLGVSDVSTAENGIAGLAACRRARPDLIVCDLGMPGSDGFQFMEQLGALGYAGGVVLASGLDDRTLNSAALMARFHRLNILATLPKPVPEAGLRAALDRLG